MDHLGWLRALVADAVRSVPVIVMALSALIVLTPLASIMRRRRRRNATKAAEGQVKIEGPVAKPDGPTLPALRESQARLILDGEQQAAMPLSGPLIRIGRHKDNDVRLADNSVHRYHALIQRTREAGFVITDLSGDNGNGVRVNGERRDRTPLSDGDVIELGRAKLKFESASL